MKVDTGSITSVWLVSKLAYTQMCEFSLDICTAGDLRAGHQCLPASLAAPCVLLLGFPEVCFHHVNGAHGIDPLVVGVVSTLNLLSVIDTQSWVTPSSCNSHTFLDFWMFPMGRVAVIPVLCENVFTLLLSLLLSLGSCIGSSLLPIEDLLVL